MSSYSVPVIFVGNENFFKTKNGLLKYFFDDYGRSHLKQRKSKALWSYFLGPCALLRLYFIPLVTKFADFDTT